jgi:hypothetical protein
MYYVSQHIIHHCSVAAGKPVALLSSKTVLVFSCLCVWWLEWLKYLTNTLWVVTYCPDTRIRLSQPRATLATTALGEGRGTENVDRPERALGGRDGATQRAPRVRPHPQRRARPMRPSPSLHYVSTRLDQRRRRHHRARRLWGTGLTLLGLGLLLIGWWVTLRLPSRFAPQAAAVAPAVVPAPPSGASGTHWVSVEPLWERPVFLEPGARQNRACQTRPPWRAACSPGDVVDPGFSTLPWRAMDPSRMPWELALPGRGPLPLQTVGTLSGPRPPGLPERGDHLPQPLSSPSCGAAPCPAAHAVGRSEPSRARLTQGWKPRVLRPASPRRAARPVPPQRRVSDYVATVLSEPETLAASP